MSKEIKVIDEREVLGKHFRVYGDIENPLFLAKDVAEWIDYSKTSQGYYNTSKMLMTIDDDEKVTITNNNSGGSKLFLTEDGLYEVLMQSRKPIAKQFKKKVKQILKQIRKTGGYIPVNEDDDEKTIMAKALRIMERTIKEKDTIIENQQDTIDYLTMTSVKGKTLDDISSATGVSKKEIELYCFNNNWYHRFDKDVLIDKECYVSRTGKNRIEFTKEGFDVLVKVFQPKKFKNLF